VATYLIFYILGFVKVYILENINEISGSGLEGSIELIWKFLRVWVIYLLISILLGFREIHLSKSLRSWIFITASFLLILLLIRSFYFQDSVLLNIPYYGLNILEKHHELIKIMLLIAFLFFWGKKPNRSKKMSRHFSLYFMIAYTLSFSISVTIINFSLSELAVLVLTTFRWVFFLLAPSLWIKFIYIPNANYLSLILDENQLLGFITRKYDISSREQDIVRLIIDGRSNNAIKDELCISYHTVKNHLSNIYRKLNVNSRHELVHLFVTEKEKQRDSFPDR
jgi:DNA-binding CsgD family transcriptional regulator